MAVKSTNKIVNTFTDDQIKFVVKSLQSSSKYATREKYYDSLNKIFKKHHIEEASYCIGTLKDDATCLVTKGNFYEVFYYERGYKQGLQNFNDIEAAGICFIRRAVTNGIKKSIILRENKTLVEKGIPTYSRADVEKIIKMTGDRMGKSRKVIVKAGKSPEKMAGRNPHAKKETVTVIN